MQGHVRSWLFAAGVLAMAATGCADLTRTSDVRLIKERPVPAKAEPPPAPPTPAGAMQAGMPGAMPGMQRAPGAKGG
jgi:hypothetical protein